MMKKLVILSVALSTMVLVGCSHQSPVKETTRTQPAPTTKSPAPEAQVVSTNYVAYSPEVVDLAQENGEDVALFFHSKSCGSCAKLDGDIVKNDSNIPSGFKIVKVDWDENQDLAKRYNVEKYHTVAFLEGEAHTNIKGLFTLDDVLAAHRGNKRNQGGENTVTKTNYTQYSPEAVTLAEKEGKDVAVFFHSKTCGSCAKLHTDLAASVSDIPDDLVVLKADWDENQELAKEYKVEKYHTVSFLGNGEAKNVKGLFTLEDILNAKNSNEGTQNTVTKTNYTQYSPEAVTLAQKEGKDVAVFFHSKTCGSCAKLDTDLAASVSDIPDDLVVLKADWDENQELAKEYKVEKYHTVSFLGNGEAKNVKGLFTLEDILNAKKLPSA